MPDEDELVSLGGEPGAEEPSGIKADNEFLLSAGDSLDEDESDSGSQVIALEDSESFDQDAATMLKADEGAALGEDAFQPLDAESALEGAGPGMAAAAQPTYVTTVAAERPYSVANVISLGLVAGMLALSGMMMVDVMLNMWSFDAPNGISTGLMDAFVSMIGM